MPRRNAKVDKETEVHIPDFLEIDGQLIPHNVWVGGRRTSVRLEAVMWTALREISERESMTINQTITLIARRRHANASLTATIRAFLIAYYRAVVTLAEQGGLAPEDKPFMDTLENAVRKA
ncbi:MAG: hypothetical protein RLY86_162 [Pseudomonadota bacterium]|jgi:predicted DNA-binding ribbon-helix-helix protein